MLSIWVLAAAVSGELAHKPVSSSRNYREKSRERACRQTDQSENEAVGARILVSRCLATPNYL